MKQYTTTITNNNRVSLLSQFDCVVPLRTQETNGIGGTFRLGLKNRGRQRRAAAKTSNFTPGALFCMASQPLVSTARSLSV